ncbi:MAG: heavy metal-binding domain-containing protein, partial [Phycisphaerales bacterium]|nr:heavy metal-binding domain-containing protein [Phycisphaerales bacterium]
RAKHVGRDIAASIKNLVGGELRGYTELLTEARRQSIQRMMAEAQSRGANAVVNVRFTTSAITQGAAELYAYGTAVRLEPLRPDIPPAEQVGLVTPPRTAGETSP